MYREIGGEFWDIPISDGLNSIFPNSTFWFLSGRSALRSIINDIKDRHYVKTVALPSWCCDSIIIPFISEGIVPKFYPVYCRNGIFTQDLRDDCDITFVMDYFGYTSEFEATSGIVIRDLTHGIFCNNHSDADYYFGSLRKWAGFLTGGFAWSKENFALKCVECDYEYVALRKDAMAYKCAYINGNSNNKDYLQIFSKAEKLLETDEISGAYSRDILLANKIDLETVKYKRRLNAEAILEYFGEHSIFPTLQTDDCPLFVPLRLKERDRIRNHLISNRIYCPIHWPVTAYHNLKYNTEQIYNEEISIVCDQRYDLEDMNKIISVLKEVI